MAKPAVWPLEGVVQHYDWGGFSLIPQLLGRENPERTPWAEWWLGAHPKGPARLLIDGEYRELDDLIAEDPDAWLGRETIDRFGPQLPFLFKVLDVRSMLSIQLHPSIPAAVAGFEREEAAGIPRLAPNRNYKDRNHKPEFMLALTDFWLLHGFKPESAVAASLQEVPGWGSLLPIFEQAGIRGLYQYVMELPQEEVTKLLQPLFDQLSENPPIDRGEADFWAWEAFRQYTIDGQYDRGIFSIYWFNLVFLKPDEGIFQGAGIPHAYLHGANIELMANSDNVLRGGLTPKHIDVKELLANMDFRPVDPAPQKGEMEASGLLTYPVPVEGFQLAEIQLKGDEILTQEFQSPSIYLVYRGTVVVSGMHFDQGQSFYVAPGAKITLKGAGADSVHLFSASAAIR